jgi:hypothetical protein
MRIAWPLFHAGEHNEIVLVGSISFLAVRRAHPLSALLAPRLYGVRVCVPHRGVTNDYQCSNNTRTVWPGVLAAFALHFTTIMAARAAISLG